MEPAAVQATTGTLRTLSDGSVRLQLDIEPSGRSHAIHIFGEPGTPIALTVLNGREDYESEIHAQKD